MTHRGQVTFCAACASVATIACNPLWGVDDLSFEANAASTGAGGNAGGGDGGDSQSGGAGGAEPGGQGIEIPKHNVVVRYLIDTASGEQVRDDTTALDLDLDEHPNFGRIHTESGHGLVWEQADLNVGASASIAPPLTALENVEAGTLEVVATVLEGSGPLFYLGAGHSAGQFSLVVTNTDQLAFRMSGGTVAQWDAPLGERHVYHVVFTGLDRAVRLYVDGQEQGPEPASSIAVPSEWSAVGNLALGFAPVQNGFRSIRGIIAYAALYAEALNAGTVAEHATALLRNDDLPPSGM